MAYERILSRDPLTMTKEIFRVKDDNTFEIVTVSDIEPILQGAWDERKEYRGPGGGRWKDGMQKVASIPLGVYQDLVNKGITKDKNAFRKWLNDSENQVFRTRPGRI